MSWITVDKVYEITEWVYQRKTKWINRRNELKNGRESEITDGI